MGLVIWAVVTWRYSRKAPAEPSPLNYETDSGSEGGHSASESEGEKLEEELAKLRSQVSKLHKAHRKPPHPAEPQPAPLTTEESSDESAGMLQMPDMNNAVEMLI